VRYGRAKFEHNGKIEIGGIVQVSPADWDKRGVIPTVYVLDHLLRTCTPFHGTFKHPGVPDQRPALVAQVNDFLHLVVDMPSIAPPDMFDQSGLEPWHAALDALMADADAEVPSP
jgi:hypothetical protein